MNRKSENKRIYGCALLAGGAGSRLGSVNKAELEYEGSTFAQRISAELDSTGMRCYLSAANYDLQLPDGWTLVRDSVKGRDGFAGPVGGIYSCLKKAAEDGLEGLFFVPCDAPLFSRTLIDKLAEHIGDDADAVCWVSGDGRIQTAFGWYSTECLPQFERDIADGKYKIIKTLETLRLKTVRSAEYGIDDRLFTNINSAEEYRKLTRTDAEEKESVIDLEYAIRILCRETETISETIELPFDSAAGYSLAQDVRAAHDQPPFPRSPLDGYALRAADTKGACKERPVILKVTGETDAGGSPGPMIHSGEALRIMTGAPIPDGADTVIRQEDTDYGEDSVQIYREMSEYGNYCFKGEDYHEGDVLLEEGEYIGPSELGMLASAGCEKVKVKRRIRAAVISTGDELVDPGEILEAGKIYDSNRFTIRAQLEEWGIEVISCIHSPDDPAKAAELIRGLSGSSDVVITTGGVSVGKKDIMHEVYEILGVNQLFWRVKIKPGSAMMAGLLDRVPILSLSGNPYAAFADLHLIVRPVLGKLAGNDSFDPIRIKATLADDYDRKSPMRRFIRAYVQNGIAHIDGHTGGNGVVSSGRHANALIEIPAGTGALAAGTAVKVILTGCNRS